MDAPRRRRTSSTVSFSLFETPRQFSERGENVAPIVVASRQRRASIAQQHSPVVVQSSNGLENLINEASINASKAAATLFTNGIESDSKKSDRTRRLSTFSSGKTPTPSNAPTRKHSICANSPQIMINNMSDHECINANIVPEASNNSDRSHFNKTGPLSSKIVREYLAHIAGVEATTTQPGSNTLNLKDKVLASGLNAFPAFSAQNSQHNFKLNSDQSAVQNVLAALPMPFQMPNSPTPFTAFPLFYQTSRTRNNSNSSSAKTSSTGGGKGVSFWFGDGNTSSVYPGYFDGYESDSGASVCSLGTAHRDTQIDQIREAVRRLDNEYNFHHNHSSHDHNKRYGPSFSESATPIYRGKKANHNAAQAKLLADDLAARLAETVGSSLQIGTGRMPDLTQVYGPLPQNHRYHSRDSIVPANGTSLETKTDSNQSTKVGKGNMLSADVGSTPIGHSSPLARSSTSRAVPLDQLPSMATSASFNCSTSSTSSSLLAAIDKRIKAQEANIMAPVSF